MKKKHSLFALLIAVLVTSADAQTSGLASRSPIAAYLNGVLPSSVPGTAYEASDVFPALRFKDPIKMLQRPGSSQIWVITQDGEVWAFDKNSPASKTLILDIKDICVAHDEGDGDSGLLGIVFHPQFGQAGSANRGFVYLYYSYRRAGIDWNVNSYNRLSRFTLPDGATQIDRNSQQVLINQFDRKTWHNGGDMFFGSDGFLYLSNGDEGDEVPGAEAGNSQKINDGLFSGVVRIDVDRNASRSHPIRRQPRSSGPPPSGWEPSYTQNYYVPNDNPWVATDGSALEEFWAIGLRSPHRMSYDAVTGKAILCDTGHDQMEEVDVLSKGANYQWAFLEGTAPGKILDRIGPGVQMPPIYTYSDRTIDGSASIGGYVYRGIAHSADLGGKYIFGDFITGNVWALSWQESGTPRKRLLTVPNGAGYRGLSGFGIDADGEHYMMILGEQGRILKLQSKGSGAQPPATLSATKAFSSLASLTPASGVIPFNVNSPLWSDGAIKQRWIALPNNGTPYDAGEVINFSATGEWNFPAGTVLIKHFDLATNESNPGIRKRLETRFFVRATNGWYGMTYKWRADGSDADLLADGASQDITITQADGSTRVQHWDYPSRENCMTCHTDNAGGVLGPKTRQLNGDVTYPTTGITANQLTTWSAIGMFDTTLSTAQIASFAKTVPLTDASASLEMRMRSYVDSNCSHCHRPNGVWRANSDMRFDTPLALQGIVNGVLENDFGISGMHEVTPGSVSQTMMDLRLNALNKDKMPPLGRNVVDQTAITTLRQWIAQLASGGSLFTGADIGPVGVAGSTTLANGIYTVRGSGADIYFSSDSFQFASASITGDGEIKARVTSQTNTASWAKAGVMMREGLATGSRHAMMYVTPYETRNGFDMLMRTTRNGSTTDIAGPANNAPPNNWVRLVRSGSTITGYASANGATWTQVSVASYASLPATLYFGLAVTSASNSVLGTATFDNVQITGAGTPPPNQAPVLVQPSNQSTVRGAVASLQVQASDPDGNTLTYSASGLPSGLAINTTTGLINGTVGTSAADASTVTVSATDGSLSSSKSFTWTTTSATTSPALSGADIGAVGLAGSTSANSSSGVFTIKGSGAGIYQSVDSFHFTSTSLTGDGEIKARVTSLTNTNPWSKAGVMIREDLSDSSRMGFMFVTPQIGFGGNYRSTAGASRVSVSGLALNSAPNNWVRIVRMGAALTGYASANGSTWTQVFTTTLTNLASTARVGLAVTSSDSSLLASATFDNIEVSGSSVTPPVIVAGTDVGAVALPGSTVFTSSSGLYTVKGSGDGIYQGADAFHFAKTRLDGDGEIKARITSLTNTNPWSKAGVMIREDITAGSRFGLVFVTPQNGFGGNYRLTAGALREYASGSALNASPNNWVRIVRTGNVLTGFTSANGTAWTQVFATTLTNLSTSAYFGLAVTATDNSQIATATFDNVQITGTPAASASQNASNTLVTLQSQVAQPVAYPSSWNQWVGTYEVSASNADGDYNSDLMEYALGEDPRSGATGGGLHFIKGEDGRFGVTFGYPSAVSDVDYGIETSVDLASWTPLQTTPMVIDGLDGYRTVTYTALDGLLGTEGAATVFARLRVTHRASGVTATGESLSLERVPFAAGSQTFGYANVKAPLFAGLVSGVLGNSVNLAASTFADTPRQHYMEVRDGLFAGHRFDIASFSEVGLTVDVSSPRNTASAVPDLTGVPVVIRQHVTLDEILDKTALIGGRTSSLSDKASFYNGTGYVSYWLYNANTADPSKATWIATGDAALANAGSRIVAPGEGLFIKSSRNTSMIIGGNVRTNSFIQVLNPGQSFIARAFPLAGSASSSGFSTDNGLIASRQKTSADQLVLWRGDDPGGVASFSTLWYAQMGTAAFWVSAENASLTDLSDSVVWQPHRAVFLKRTGTVTTTTLVPVPWSVTW